MSVKRYILDLPHRQYKGEDCLRQLHVYVQDYFSSSDSAKVKGLKKHEWATAVYNILLERNVLSAETSGLLVIAEPRRIAHRSKYVQLLKEFKLGKKLHGIKKKKLKSTKKPVADPIYNMDRVFRTVRLPQADGRAIRFVNYANAVVDQNNGPA